MSWSDPREKFAAELAKGLSQTAAYRIAFPGSRNWKDATVWARASELAADSKVLGRVAELKAMARSEIEAATTISIERIAAELARLSLVDVRRLVRADGTPIPINELDEDTARAIVGIDLVSVGNADLGVGQVLKFKLADKGANLERLAKLLGYFERDNKQKNPLGGFNPQQFFADIFRKPAVEE